VRFKLNILSFFCMAAIILFPVPFKSRMAELENRILNIQSEADGQLGVYIEDLRVDDKLGYRADRNWYLSSVVKVFIGVAVLQLADGGDFLLTDKVCLEGSDYVDGAGELQSRKRGECYSIKTLLKKMISDSDSTAADMLLRLVGEDRLNDQIIIGISASGIGQITSFTQVRKDAYGELHPGAKELTNKDFIELKNIKDHNARLLALLKKLKLKKEDLLVPSIDEAFERYYSTGLNSATLVAVGEVLRRVVRGELLSKESTEYFLEIMKEANTGEHRIKAGLPRDVRFAYKTGTQIKRMCNVGIIMSEDEVSEIIIAACIEGYSDQDKAEETLKKVGEAISEKLLT